MFKLYIKIKLLTKVFTVKLDTLPRLDNLIERKRLFVNAVSRNCNTGRTKERKEERL